jgi:hypothetical protein
MGMTAGAADLTVPGRSSPLLAFARAGRSRLGGPGRAVGLVGLAFLVGAAIPFAPASTILVGLVALLLVAAVALRPAIGAYVLLGVTPLIAGIDRGLVIPVLRPNEALLVTVGAGLAIRGVVRTATSSGPSLRLDGMDSCLLLLAFTSSVLPLVWMTVRGQAIAQDDVLYALIVWKYYGIYLVARSSIRTERKLHTCLWITMISASIVAILAILQSLQLFGVAHALSKYYAPYGSAQALLNNRGGSTLSLPIAVADLMIFNVAIAVGLLTGRRAHRAVLVAMAMLFAVAVIAAGEFSGVLGLVLGFAVIAAVTRRVGRLAAFIPLSIPAAFALRPVIQKRMQGFDTASGLPPSWAGRLNNLNNYFWPKLFSHGNFILGVRPAARVSSSSMATGYVWIESGYTWLLWGGGLPFLLAFLYFLRTGLRRHLPLARSRQDAVGAAALAVVVALVVIGVLMVFDPHLTYRGSADLVFSLMGLIVGVTRHEQAAAPDGRPEIRMPGRQYVTVRQER